MGKYLLTERQKNMLRSLIPGLQDGTIESQWSMSVAGGKVRGILGLSSELRVGIWKDVKPSDFEAYIDCGFFTEGLVLNEALIVDAVNRNFEDAEQSITLEKGLKIMVKCVLTERQKNMIRSLAPSLQEGTVDTEWILILGDDRIMAVFGLDDDGKLWREVWDGVKYSDFDTFVNCGFFNTSNRRNYTLNEGLIIEAIERNFEDDPQIVHSTNHYDFRGSNIQSSILNVASTLTDVQQSISSAPSLSDGAKAQLTQLIGELKDELAKVPEQEAEAAETIAHHAQVAVEQLNREKPNRTILKSSVDEFEKGIKNVGRILPPIIAIGAQIATILRPFIGV